MSVPNWGGGSLFRCYEILFVGRRFVFEYLRILVGALLLIMGCSVDSGMTGDDGGDEVSAAKPLPICTSL